MRCYRQVAKLLSVIALVSALRALGQEPKGASVEGLPVWKVDVRQFGYEKFPRRMVRPLRLVVDFADNDHVAIAWINPETTAENKRRAPRVGEPARLHVVILDAKTGLKQSQKDWSTAYSQVPIFFGIPAGRFSICTDNSLRLLSASLDIIKQQELPHHGSCQNLTLQFSPSKRTLLLSILADHSRHIELLSVETGKVLSEWTEEQQLAGAAPKGTIAISDVSAAGYCGVPAEICLRRFNEQDWHPFRPDGLDLRMSKWQRTPASFINDEHLAIELNVTTIATVRGDVLFQVTLPKGHYFLKPIPSAGGERFAIKEERLRGLRSEPLDMYPFQSDDRVLVYSIKDKRAVFSLELRGTSPWSPRDIHDNAVALSPNGTLLALLSDGLLRVYAIPQGNPDDH